jgi:hypothetical protein
LLILGHHFEAEIFCSLFDADFHDLVEGIDDAWQKSDFWFLGFATRQKRGAKENRYSRKSKLSLTEGVSWFAEP